MNHKFVFNSNKTAVYDVYVGRPSKWGNPYVIHKGLDRDQAIKLYINFILKNKALLKDLHELKGKTLACHCAPHRCHADVLAFLANDVSQEAISDLDSVFRIDLESELIKFVNEHIFGASLV